MPWPREQPRQACVGRHRSATDVIGSCPHRGADQIAETQAERRLAEQRNEANGAVPLGVDVSDSNTFRTTYDARAKCLLWMIETPHKAGMSLPNRYGPAPPFRLCPGRVVRHGLAT